MKVFRYHIDFQFVKGSDLIIADTLSRAFVETNNKDEIERPRILKVNTFDARITEIRHATINDTDMQKLIGVISSGWPRKDQRDHRLTPYYSFRDTLIHEEGIILKGETVLIPESMRSVMKTRLHRAHLGYDSMLRRARGTIFWHGMAAEIKQMVNKWEQCERLKPQNQRESLNQLSDGNGPWDKIGTDLFVIENRNYLLVIDYFTNFIEIAYIPTLSSKQVIEKLKKQFSRVGISCQIISDGEPQYTSTEFAKFMKT